MKAGPAAAAGAGAESSHQQDAAARVKREAGVKRERGLDGEEEDYCPRSATAADRVDLTEEVRDSICCNCWHRCGMDAC
jgi:anaerobic selenocysteine-containing dehydrogenase